MADKKEDSKKVYVVKDRYEEIQGIYETEYQATQLAAFLNSKYLKAQPTIVGALHRQSYTVHTYPIREFYRRKKLFYLVTAYFEKASSPNLLNHCPYALARVERTLIIDYEIDDQVNMRVEGVHHIYFTESIKKTEKELWSIAYNKMIDKWSTGIIPFQ